MIVQFLMTLPELTRAGVGEPYECRNERASSDETIAGVVWSNASESERISVDFGPMRSGLTGCIVRVNAIHSFPVRPRRILREAP